MLSFNFAYRLHDAVVDANTYVATCVAACVQELGPVGIHTRYAVWVLTKLLRFYEE